LGACNIWATESQNIPWDDVIKKEARGINDYDLGEVQEITSNNVLTEKGLIDTKLFEIPKHLAVEFDGHKLVFNVTESDAKNMYLKATSSSSDEVNHGSQETVPLLEERLEPTKKEIIEASYNHKGTH